MSRRTDAALDSRLWFWASWLAVLLSTPSAAQENISEVDIETVAIAPGVYMLVGAGGNVGLSIGEDGPLLIDDQFAPLTDKISKAVSDLTEQPLRFVINTHWHFDHTGGNENLGTDGALIVAHEKVRERLAKGQHVPAFDRSFPPAPQAALPVITFSRDLRFFWNDDVLEVVHPTPAHTDGDAIIYFKTANVVHAGDLFWNGIYPLIDASSGGSALGMVEAVEDILERIDDETRVIPGHGPPGSKADLQAYHHMLSTVVARVAALKRAGKDVTEAVTQKPTAEFDAEWADGIFGADEWVRIVYSAL